MINEKRIISSLNSQAKTSVNNLCRSYYIPASKIPVLFVWRKGLVTLLRMGRIVNYLYSSELGIHNFKSAHQHSKDLGLANLC